MSHSTRTITDDRLQDRRDERHRRANLRQAQKNFDTNLKAQAYAVFYGDDYYVDENWARYIRLACAWSYMVGYGRDYAW